MGSPQLAYGRRLMLWWYLSLRTPPLLETIGTLFCRDRRRHPPRLTVRSIALLSSRTFFGRVVVRLVHCRRRRRARTRRVVHASTAGSQGAPWSYASRPGGVGGRDIGLVLATVSEDEKADGDHGNADYRDSPYDAADDRADWNGGEVVALGRTRR